MTCPHLDSSSVPGNVWELSSVSSSSLLNAANMISSLYFEFLCLIYTKFGVEFNFVDIIITVTLSWQLFVVWIQKFAFLMSE